MILLKLQKNNESLEFINWVMFMGRLLILIEHIFMNDRVIGKGGYLWGEICGAVNG